MYRTRREVTPKTRSIFRRKVGIMITTFRFTPVVFYNLMCAATVVMTIMIVFVYMMMALLMNPKNGIMRQEGANCHKYKECGCILVDNAMEFG